MNDSRNQKKIQKQIGRENFRGDRENKKKPDGGEIYERWTHFPVCLQNKCINTWLIYFTKLTYNVCWNLHY